MRNLSLVDWEKFHAWLCSKDFFYYGDEKRNLSKKPRNRKKKVKNDTRR